MRLRISHTTRYEFEHPAEYGLQQLRKTPKNTRAQTVLDWRTTVEGGRKELFFDDFHRNRVELVSFETGTMGLTIRSEGEVEMTDTAGIVGPHEGYAPLWLFQRSTGLTRIGPGCRELAREVEAGSDLDLLHALSAVIRDRVAYEIGVSHAGWTAEDALEAGHGVCQDHAHVFVATARHMGFPARYVSGYLMMDDRVEQEATHAWAEAYVEGLGWVGFDISNGISPDTRYVRVATGLDYDEAAPVRGRRTGTGGETLSVTVEVAQQ
jgi:transglutaminase-like putative cysteine protease